MSYLQEVRWKLQDFFSGVCWGRKGNTHQAGKKKTRGVELMLQKLKVFLLKREMVAHVVHIRDRKYPEIP